MNKIILISILIFSQNIFSFDFEEDTIPEGTPLRRADSRDGWSTHTPVPKAQASKKAEKSSEELEKEFVAAIIKADLSELGKLMNEDITLVSRLLDLRGKRALHIVASEGDKSEEEYLKVTRYLLSGIRRVPFRNRSTGFKETIDSKSYSIPTPLLLAITSKRFNIASLLLREGANPNYTDGDGWTALMHATELNNSKMVSELVKAGANPTTKIMAGYKYLGETALLIAIHNYRRQSWDPISKTFRPYSGKQDASQETIIERDKIVSMLINMPGAPVIAKDDYDRTPLHWAVFYEDIKAIEGLFAITNENNPKRFCNYVDNKKQNPLMLACDKGNKKVADMLLSECNPPVLVNAKDQKGKTAIRIAIEKGHIELFNPLIAAGAIVTKEDRRIAKKVSGDVPNRLTKAIREKGGRQNVDRKV